MDNSKMVEQMKKIIEEKKKKSAQQGMPQKTGAKKIGEKRKGIKRFKQGGMFDK
jgi:ribosome-binding protein aMBF1 (putative translation factor)